MPTWIRRPWFMTPMRSATVIASCWSWVTMTKVRPSRSCSCINSNCVSPRSFLSSAARGSSSRRTRERDALALAAGELVRLALAQAFEPHQCQHLLDPRRDFRLGTPLLLEPEFHIALDREVRKQRVALEHHVDRPPIRRYLRNIFTIEQNASFVGRVQTGEEAQQRGLAAARRTE